MKTRPKPGALQPVRLAGDVEALCTIIARVIARVGQSHDLPRQMEHPASRRAPRKGPRA